MTSSWFFLSTLNYDARSTTHHILIMFNKNVIPTCETGSTWWQMETKLLGDRDRSPFSLCSGQRALSWLPWW